MSRTFSKEIMGFYAIDPKHHAAITSLVAPATPAHKLLDPYTGEGKFLDVAAKAWHMTPYANDLAELTLSLLESSFNSLRGDFLIGRDGLGYQGLTRLD